MSKSSEPTTMLDPAQVKPVVVNPVSEHPDLRASRTQRLAMKAAGLLLNGRGSTVKDTLHTLVTEVGGYKHSLSLKDMAKIVGHDAMLAYERPDSSSKITGLKADIVSDAAASRGSRLSDEGRIDLSTAVSATTSKEEVATDVSMRGRVANRLVKHATKDVGIDPHLKEEEAKNARRLNSMDSGRKDREVGEFAGDLMGKTEFVLGDASTSIEASQLSQQDIQQIDSLKSRIIALEEELKQFYNAHTQRDTNS